jgi:hypothetical protein
MYYFLCNFFSLLSIGSFRAHISDWLVMHYVVRSRWHVIVLQLTTHIDDAYGDRPLCK